MQLNFPKVYEELENQEYEEDEEPDIGQEEVELEVGQEEEEPEIGQEEVEIPNNV